jgi:hypothetical protein
MDDGIGIEILGAGCYQAAVLCDAIIASAAEGRRVRIDDMMATSPATARA